MRNASSLHSVERLLENFDIARVAKLLRSLALDALDRLPE